MPADKKVLCTHCDQYLPPKWEREHRRLVNSHTPYAAAPPTFISRIHRVVDSDSDDHDDGGSAVSSRVGEGNLDADAGISGGEEYLETGGPQAAGEWGMDADAYGSHDEVFENGLIPVPPATGAELNNHWRRMFEMEDSDLDSDPEVNDEPAYPKLEDSDDESDEGFIDWATIEAGSGLSAWDQLGEGYERDAAALDLCKFQYDHDCNVI